MTQHNNRRRSCGRFMPNIFFLLQLIGIALLVNITLQVMTFSTSLLYGIAAVVFLAVIYCIDKRSAVLTRQECFYNAKF